MTPLEHNISLLKDLHSKMDKLNANKKKLTLDILRQSELVDKMKLKEEENKPISFTTRDVNLAIDFILENKKVSSRQIIDYLNDKLKDLPKRWPTILDGNLFMAYVGKWLKDQYSITWYKEGKMSFWEKK